MSDVEALSRLVPEGGRIAVGDGAGVPRELWSTVLDVMEARADVHLLLALWFTPPGGAERLPVDRVHTVISGFGLRRAIDAGRVGFVPARFSNLPSLLRGALRPDVLVASLAPVPRGLAFTTETSWQRAAISAGAQVVAALRPQAPVCDVEEPLSPGSVRVLVESDAAPEHWLPAVVSDAQRAVAERVADLVPDGARVQVGPGGLGEAVYAALRKPIAVDTGLITDPVVELDRRGLLLDQPISPYVAGTNLLYEWAPGRVRVCGVETTHDVRRLTEGRPLVAVNTGIEMDLDGQVNAEVAAGSSAGGLGGQPDYAAAASYSATGLSVMALPSRAAGNSTLVRALSGPVTTPSHDIEMVVTDRGVADLRGLSRPERRSALVRLWGDDAP